MRNKMKTAMETVKMQCGRLRNAGDMVLIHAMRKEPGIDGILVTVGLCIIALLLCVVMKDSLTDFIQSIVTAMQTKANGILTGA